ncbi:MAG: EI24 domain-containing protein [Desulfobacterales bacterium]
MGFLNGIRYNLKGLLLGLRTPSLLALGVLRFVVVLLVSVAMVSVILIYHGEIMELLWTRPSSAWVIWLWHLLSWLLALVLSAVATVAAYLLSQVLFSVFVMDLMSRITERHAAGTQAAPQAASAFKQFVYLIRQEIPRALLPVIFTLLLMGLSWFTPAGPIMTVASPLAASAFLAWDNTDLVPARRLYPFRDRFRMFYRNLPFHLGFGLLFLIPVFNLVVLSFAPVGATLYFTEKQERSS